ncbi:MAG TPA: hypothetical protein VFB12_10745 [Ktedonobacteraceae bacterium]|nr:hypothetical protein [Ktedonobacteraceae bacterium]
MLAPDVHSTVMTTEQGREPTDTTGIDDYMEGLIQFAQAVEPDSARGRERRRRAELAYPADRQGVLQPRRTEGDDPSGSACPLRREPAAQDGAGRLLRGSRLTAASLKQRHHRCPT